MLSENFTYDGVTSTSKGVKIIRMASSGFLAEKVIGDANISEIQLPGGYRPITQKITRSPIEFTLQIALLDFTMEPIEWTENKRRDIFSWLFKGDYRPLVFADRPQIKYYAMAQSGLNLNTMNGKGYVEIVFRTNSPFPYRDVRPAYKEANLSQSTILEILIDSGLAVEEIYPIVKLTRKGPSANIIRVSLEGQPAQDIIGIDNSKIPTVTEITFNGNNKTVLDQNGNSLYRHRVPEGFKFLSLGSSLNKIIIPQGWEANITYDLPILY